MGEKIFDKINIDTSIQKTYQACLLLYTVLLIVHKTFLENSYQSIFSKCDCIIGAVLAIILAVKLICIDGFSRKKWIKSNLIVFIYFLVRTITVVKTGFDYSTIRCVFFEGIYLLVLTDIILDARFVKKVLIPTTIVITFLTNIANVLLYLYYQNVVIYGSGKGIFYEYTTRVDAYMECFSFMYINPNWFGMITALTIVLAFALIEKNNRKSINIAIVCYIVFSLYCVWLSTCRSALIALIICGLVYMISKLLKRVSTKHILTCCLIGIVFAMSLISGIIISNTDTGMTKFSEMEQQLDSISTKRYTIWKECYYANKKDLILGQGSVSRELALRNEFFSEEFEEEYDSINLRAHNGYIGHLTITGILGLLLFLTLLLQRIYRSAYMDKGNWYLVVLLILIINIFECMFTLGINILCLYMFTVLSMVGNDKRVQIVKE